MDEFNHIDMTKSNKCLIVFNSITRDMHTMGYLLTLYSKRLNDNTLYVTFFDSFGLSITHYNPILQNYLKRHSPYIKKRILMRSHFKPIIRLSVEHMFVL